MSKYVVLRKPYVRKNVKSSSYHFQMMKSAFKIETAFTKAPRFGVAQLVEKIEKEIEKNVIELVKYEGSGTWEEEASGDLEEEASGDFQHDASSSEKLWHLFY